VSIEPIFLRPDPDRVLSVVAELTGIPLPTLRSPGRTHPVSHARKLAMYLLRTEAGLSHAEVGRLVGRGSATVITLTREVAKDVHGATRPEIEPARAILREGRASAEVPTRRPSPRSLGGYLVGLTAVREATGLTKKELARCVWFSYISTAPGSLTSWPGWALLFRQPADGGAGDDVALRRELRVA
jgi:Bacterial dnaA protein helix-turn-helix